MDGPVSKCTGITAVNVSRDNQIAHAKFDLCIITHNHYNLSASPFVIHHHNFSHN